MDIESSGGRTCIFDKHTKMNYHIGSFVAGMVIILIDINVIKKQIIANGGVLRTADAAREGISRTALAQFANAGTLERIARGQYILPDSIPDELYIWQQRKDSIIYSHETALFLHDMAERTPAMHSITLPTSVKLSATFPTEFKTYYIKTELHRLGAVLLPSKFGHEICAYDVERTICDVLRSRNRIDEQLVTSALKNYANRKDKDLTKLGEYAQTFRVTKILRRYLGVLL